MSKLSSLLDAGAFEQYATECSESILASLDLNTSPIPLRPIVDHCSIHRVVFGWLPVAGGLSVNEKGFLIHVQANKKDANNWAEYFNRQSDEARLLPSRVRFTIAHEIAHTFFYQWSGEKPTSLIDNPKQKMLPGLEVACNRAASAMLLPRPLLRPLVAGRTWTPSLFRSVASAFNVSTEVLLHRLERLARQDSGLISSHTLVAMIRVIQKGPEIIGFVAGRDIQQHLSSSTSRWIKLLQLTEDRLREPFSSWTVEVTNPSDQPGAAVTLCDVQLKNLYRSHAEESQEQPRTLLLTANISANLQFILPLR